MIRRIRIMINAVNKRAFKFIEGIEKSSFELWLELGTVYKVQKEFVRRGWVTPTGEPPTITSVCRWAWIYVLENPDEAREEFAKRGAFYEDNEWIRLLFDRAKGYYLLTSRKRFYDWIERKGFGEYRQFYSDVAPLHP
jgi:hypothetical protein